MIPYITQLIQNPNPTLPLIVDEDTALEFVGTFSGMHVTTWDECHTGMIPGVMLYEKEDDKQSLSIKQIRESISDMSERPYEGKMLVLFRDFDSASIEAMNASLKILEEPPAYAIILLIVANPENVLETIRSRALTFFSSRRTSYLTEDTRGVLADYAGGDEIPLIKLISTKKIEKEEAIDILSAMKDIQNGPNISTIERAIGDLMTVNESPKNILDSVILKRGIDY